MIDEEDEDLDDELKGEENELDMSSNEDDEDASFLLDEVDIKEDEDDFCSLALQ